MRWLDRFKSFLRRDAKPEHLRRGALGENAARKHLEKAGLKFLVANYRTPRGEIDLVFRDGAGSESRVDIGPQPEPCGCFRAERPTWLFSALRTIEPTGALRTNCQRRARRPPERAGGPFPPDLDCMVPAQSGGVPASVFAPCFIRGSISQP